jgi:hypothetical protein
MNADTQQMNILRRRLSHREIRDRRPCMLYAEKRGNKEFASCLTGHNAPPLKASPASGAAHGYSATRGPVSVVFDNLEVGASIDEIMEWFHLTREQVVTVIEFAARSLNAPSTMPPVPNVDSHPLR